jgi:LysR family transcriptional regulator, hydrogen peroxide-inducible genes activator
MTLQQLEYVIALDNYRHFVTAAEKCFVTQPTLTMQVKKLEDEIGIKIFNRSKKPLTPTKAGEQLIHKAREILRDVSELKDLVSNEKESMAGTFRLGIIPTLAPFLMPLFLPHFRKHHPEVKLVIRELQTLDIIKELKADTLDIGLVVTPLDESTLKEIPIFYEPFVFYHPEDHALANNNSIKPSQLDGGELLLLEEGHCFRNQALNICGKLHATDHDGFYYQSGSIETLKNMVRKGLGYTLVPQLSIDWEYEKKWIKKFEDPQPVREVSLVTHKTFNKKMLLNALQDSILKILPKEIKKNERIVKIKWR